MSAKTEVERQRERTAGRCVALRLSLPSCLSSLVIWSRASALQTRVDRRVEVYRQTRTQLEVLVVLGVSLFDSIKKERKTKEARRRRNRSKEKDLNT